jgi:hypothetical protein
VSAPSPDGADPVGALAAAADRDGAVSLPELSQAELCVLGVAGKGLVCERTWSWWTGMSEDKRQDTTGKTMELLAVRGFIASTGAGSGPDDLGQRDRLTVKAAGVAMIVAARAAPRPVVTCQLPGRDAGLQPRFFGMTQARLGLRALVCEMLTDKPSGPGGRPEFGRVIRYALISPAKAGEMLVSWAQTVAPPAGLGWEPPTVDIFGHDRQQRLHRDRFQIRPEGSMFDVTRTGQDGAPDPALRFDQMGLAQQFTSALTGAAR